MSEKEIYKMLCIRGEIRLGKGVRINEKGTQFTVNSKTARDILVENGNAIDITNGIPQVVNADESVLALQLADEKRKNQDLAKKLSELRQQVKNSGNDPDYVDPEKEALLAEVEVLKAENEALKAEAEKKQGKKAGDK
jgi:hypothetical protein